MKDIVLYAESKGVLLVAASGNDGLALGAKAEVKYPAAYPTVLAVAGATAANKPEPRSNSGSEIDIAAPWNVYTTAVGGGYGRQEGTSMSAPQAAAAAALVWAMHPDYKPYQVRAALRQSAKDIGPTGVDNASGYGLLQINRAVTSVLKDDAYEPNDRRDTAKRFPLGTKISAELAGGTDKDWYTVDAPFDGIISIQFQGIAPVGQIQPTVQMTHYAGYSATGTKETKLGNQIVEWHVKKGRNYFELQLFDKQIKSPLPYLLTSAFEIGPDAYEKNDKQYQASSLKPRSQTITGNFHQTGDRDWYAIHFETGGTLKLTLSTDSVRIDPSMAIQRADEVLEQIDENGEGEDETSKLINITPGNYYIRVYNAMSAQASPTAGQYQLKLDFKTKYTDPNEPNNKTYEATGVRPGSDYVGVIGTSTDVDWYQLRLAKRSFVRVTIKDIPAGIQMKAQAVDKRQKQVLSLQSDFNRTVMTGEKELEPGLYYIKVTGSSAFDKQYYGLRVDAQPIVAGFRDISGHWAEAEVAALNKRGIAQGRGDGRFHPNESITRAEAVSMLVKAFNPKGSLQTGFKDVPVSHWAYKSIAIAVNAGWAGGYPDGTFAPDGVITREEMAVMIARALKVPTARPLSAPFRDVEVTRWSAPSLVALKEKRIIGGYADLRYKPDQTASRAEFAAILRRATG
jgi:hypothetical protein